MRLNFTLRRQGGADVDLVAQLDATATVGDLAGFLSSSDPEPGHSVALREGGQLTLTLPDQGGSLLDPRAQISDAGLRSGMAVSLSVASRDYVSTRSGEEAVARLRVVSGPDAGREFALAKGSSHLGRDEANDVVLQDPMVSARHARINVTDSVEVIDQQSTNGVIVGGAAVPRASLRSSDVVTVGDTEFVISINPVALQSGAVVDDFIRPPVVLPRHEGKEFELPQAPEKRSPQRFPTVALIMPIIMGAGLYAITQNAASVIFVALSPLMMLGSFIEGRLAAKSEFKKATAEYESDLAALAEDVNEEQTHEVASRRAEQPTTNEALSAAVNRSELLWSRREGAANFGTIRLGEGARQTRSTFKMPTRNKAPHELYTKGQALVEAHSSVSPVPILANLSETALGLAGPRSWMMSSARALLLQTAALHAASELMICATLNSETAAEWDWLKWLPHTNSPRSPIAARHVVSGQTASSNLLNEIEQLIELRQADDAEPLPKVLLVVETGAAIEHSRAVTIAEKGPALGIMVIWLAPHPSQLPAACQVFLEVPARMDAGSAGYVVEGEIVTPIVMDLVDEDTANRVARSLAPVADIGARISDSSDLPKSVSQFSLLGPELGSDASAIIERWSQSGSILTGPYAPEQPLRKPGTLRAVIGQSAEGPHALDLRTDGPHALVGGTTGSGKSELLQSWILGMAAAHSPERVTFLLVDYKGGSAFSDCVELPHTIGLVTDLGQHEVRRALTSLSAELKYREELLAEHDGAKDLIELERHGVIEAPPSLIIVVDEFAALVKEVPEFVDGVVNVAQRGRSLGLHLILATQRPAGVIKDNLRANTNLRVALRMADEADSSDVLGSDVAAGFDPSIPGRAMSKSGPKRLVPFQAAYAGGWTNETPDAPDIQVEELSIGHPRRWERPTDDVPVQRDRDQTDIKRLVRVIKHANQLAALPEPRKAWLPELKASYDIAILPSRRRDDELVFAVGDDPENQRQPQVAFFPDREGNMAVYGTGGSGKSTMLRSMAVSAGFSSRGGPCHVYGLDFGSRGLSMLEPLPHVGSVISGQDNERVIRLISWLREELDERAVRYSAVSAATITDYRKIAGRPDEPRILVLLDGITAFRQAYESSDRSKYIDILTSVASEGRPVGIHLVISSDQRAGMHSALSSAVQRRVVLRMASDDDYSMLGVPSDVLSSDSPPGRGIDDGQVIQIAVLGGDVDTASQSVEIEEFGKALQQMGVSIAPEIRSLSSEIDMSSLPNNPEGVLLGVESSSLKPISIAPRGAFLVTGPPMSGRTTALRSLALSCRNFAPNMLFFYFGNRRSELAQLPIWSAQAYGAEDISRAAEELNGLLASRNPGDSRVMVVLEGAGDLSGGLADMALQELAKTCVAEDHWFVAEGEVSTLRTTMGFLGTVKSSRAGLVLQPDQESGALLFNTPFPRVNRNDFPQGRGFLVGSGKASVVQVARV